MTATDTHELERELDQGYREPAAPGHPDSRQGGAPGRGGPRGRGGHGAPSRSASSIWPTIIPQDPPRDRARRAARAWCSTRSVRADGRGPDDIRKVTVEVGVLPRTHGSCLFTRGETQALAVCTLGTKSDEQRVEELEGQSWKSYMLHYNFPPYSVGEVRPIRGPGRREIGHGALAERAIEPVIPADTHFPYTIRLVSDILESNGSSSMATVCGSLDGADGRRRADQGAGGRHRDGSHQGRRLGRGADRHPRRRGSPRRHGLQGHRHPRGRDRLPDGHQDRRHLLRRAAQGARAARASGRLHILDIMERRRWRRRARRCRRSRRASPSCTSIPTRSARSSGRAARSSSASPRRPARRSTSRTRARCGSRRSAASRAVAPRS